MDETMMPVEKLKKIWQEMSAEVKRDKKVKPDVFEKAFAQTYGLLLERLQDGCLDKALVEMVAEAYLFANIKDETLNSHCLAAFVLTERMLSCCAFGHSFAGGPVSIYVAESRRDVELDFADVDASITRLVRVYDEIAWQKLMA